MTIAPRVVDLEREPLPSGPYDVIVTLNYLQREIFGALESALAPGGLLLYETLGRAHVDELGRSFNRDYLLEQGELLRVFAGLEVVDHHEGVVERSGGPRGVAGLVARRPTRRSPPSRREAWRIGAPKRRRGERGLAASAAHGCRPESSCARAPRC